MSTEQNVVKGVIRNNRYLTLATSDGGDPWIAPLEYVCDDDLNLYFFSLVDSAHANHIRSRERVAVAIFGADQPKYEPGKTLQLKGVQMSAVAAQLDGDFPPVVQQAIDVLQPPMPPYAAFAIRPTTIWLPQIADGLNKRVEVKLG